MNEFAGSAKLKIRAESVRVQLEDGTIVEDEDYFACVEPNTTIVLIGDI